MKNIKSNKGITNMTLITIVLVIIILMLLLAVIYLVKNPNTTYITQNLPTEQSQLSSTVTENKEETVKENIQVSNNVINSTIEAKNNKISSDKFFEDMEEAYISKNLKLLSNNKSYSVNYVLKGKDTGKIIIKEENKIISEEKLDKEVVDMYSVYENVYLLLEDGTIGQISLEENDYKLKMLEGYNNIIRIQEVLVGNDEGDGIILSYILVAIDSNGKVKYITVTVD